MWGITFRRLDMSWPCHGCVYKAPALRYQYRFSWNNSFKQIWRHCCAGGARVGFCSVHFSGMLRRRPLGRHASPPPSGKSQCLGPTPSSSPADITPTWVPVVVTFSLKAVVQTLARRNSDPPLIASCNLCRGHFSVKKLIPEYWDVLYIEKRINLLDLKVLNI